MTLYFFHVRNGETLIEDEEGSDYQTDDAALLDVEAAAREMIVEKINNGETIGSEVIHVTDESGRFIAELPLRKIALGCIGSPDEPISMPGQISQLSEELAPHVSFIALERFAGINPEGKQ